LIDSIFGSYSSYKLEDEEDEDQKEEEGIIPFSITMFCSKCCFQFFTYSEDLFFSKSVSFLLQKKEFDWLDFPLHNAFEAKFDMIIW